MSAAPQAIQVALRYDGKAFVPDQPFPNLPAGTVIHVWTSAEPTDWPPEFFRNFVGRGEDLGNPAQPLAISKPDLKPEEIQRLLDSTAGAWAGLDFIEPDELPYDREEP